MGFSLTVYSLSALRPAELEYTYNSSEKLKYTTITYSNGLSFNSYEALNKLQDVALSKKNILFLTDTKPLTSIFEQTTELSPIGKIAGSFYLSTTQREDVKVNSDNTLSLELSSTNKAIITVVPINSTTVELYSGGIQLVVDSNYPYTLRASNAALAPDQIYRKRFKFEYANNLMTFQTVTKEGTRYISYGKDKILRAIGLTLNNVNINPHLFVPSFVTNSSLNVGYDPTSMEVKYYNDIESFKNRTTLDIKEKTVAETNLLISCATSDITKREKANINIALLRTNYTSTGAYAPTLVASADTGTITLSGNYLSDVDETVPILIEDLINKRVNNKDGFLIYI